MDCELVYAIRPKIKKSFATLIWELVYPEALKHPWLRKTHSSTRAYALSHWATKIMNDPVFRKKQGWSRNSQKID
jgi:hypothetical protein